MTGCALIGHGYWGTIIEKYLADAGFEELYVYTRGSSISYEQILEDEGVKAVIICAPLSAHYELVKQALLAGKHVFCEKMLTADPEQARELYEIAAAQEKVLFTDYIYQYSPSVRKLVENFSRLKGNISIEAEISQYGKFYEDCGVLENIGVHMLTVIGMLTKFNRNIKLTDMSFIGGENGHHAEKELCFNICENSDAPAAESSIDAKAAPAKHSAGKKPIKVKLVCSIISEGKTRTVTVRGENGFLSFDMMSEETFVSEINGKRKVTSFNEGDNLKTSLARFAKYIADIATPVAVSAMPKMGSYEYNKACCLYVEDMTAML